MLVASFALRVKAIFAKAPTVDAASFRLTGASLVVHHHHLIVVVVVLVVITIIVVIFAYLLVGQKAVLQLGQ